MAARSKAASTATKTVAKKANTVANSLRTKDVTKLTETERLQLKRIRDSISMPDKDTLMQKVITKEIMDKYLDGTYTQVGGFVTKADDVANLKTYEDIYKGLRLDYPDTAYNSALDDSLAVIRYKTSEVSKIEIPYSKEFEGTTAGDDPFTGNGFTKALNGQIIPEYKSNGLHRIEDGAELIEISRDGTEKIKGIYSKIDKQFIPIE